MDYSFDRISSLLFDRKYTFYWIFLIAFVLRIYGLGDHSLWIDEAGTSSLVETFLQSGVSEYPSGVESNRSRPFILITSLCVFFLGLNDFALRLPSLLFSVLTINLVFRWGKELFDFRIATLAALILTFSSWHIGMAQNARMYSMFQLLYLLSFYLIYRYESNGKCIEFFLLIITISLSLLTHITGYILIFTVPLLFIWLSKTILSKKFISISLLVLVAGLIGENIYFNFDYIFDKLQYYPNTAIHQVSWFINNLPFLSSLGPLGLILSVLDQKKVFKIFVMAIIPPLLVYIFLVEMPASRYLFFALPFLTLLTSYFVMSLTDKIVRIKFFRNKKIIFGFLLILTSIYNPLNPSLGSSTPQADFKSIYLYIDDEKAREDVIIAGRTLPADHYLRDPDYVLKERNYSSTYFENGDYIYSNSSFVENKTNLNNIIENNSRGWIVASDIVQMNIDYSLESRIKQLNLVKRERNISLWTWNN